MDTCTNKFHTKFLNKLLPLINRGSSPIFGDDSNKIVKKRIASKNPKKNYFFHLFDPIIINK